MSSTHILLAKYITYTVFKLPSGITSYEDLDSNPDIKSWGVKYNQLSIEYKNGNTIEIESEFLPDESTDYKYPQNMDVEPIEDYQHFIRNFDD